jgi:16S rRNA (adenine1518-N6/adenine1519-N6)-dimethyltransferase
VDQRLPLLDFLHRSFAHRRKTLLNNWSGSAEAAPLAAALARLGVSAAVRAEAIDPLRLLDLYEACRGK